MLYGGGMHELRSFVDEKSDIGASNSGILKITHNALIEMWVGHRSAFVFGKVIIG